MNRAGNMHVKSENHFDQRELGDAFEVPVGAAGRRRGLVTTEEMAEAGVFEETSYPMWVPEVALSQVSS
jgi:hypothetical protein